MPENTSRLSTALADRYRIERRLGEGRHGHGLLAEDLKHKRKVVVRWSAPGHRRWSGSESGVENTELKN